MKVQRGTKGITSLILTSALDRNNDTFFSLFSGKQYHYAQHCSVAALIQVSLI
jgi:hypothetical protein